MECCGKGDEYPFENTTETFWISGNDLYDMVIKNADVQNELKKILAYEMYFSHEYEQAVEAFEAIYLDKYMEYDTMGVPAVSTKLPFRACYNCTQTDVRAKR